VTVHKPIAFAVASILSVIIALPTPAFAEQGRGGSGGGGGGRQGGGGAGGGQPPAGGGRSGGAGAPVYGGRPVYAGRVAYRGGYYPYYGRRYYGYPYAYGWYGYPSFYAGWGWGLGWGWPYAAYRAYPSYPYAVGGYDASASLRLDVTPKEAEVYVDGYLVGTVDDFDGTFQRLRVPPGAHELTLYRDGFTTVHQSLRLASGSTFKVSYTMQPLAAGEVAEPRPTPPPPPPDEASGSRQPAASAAAGFGTLAIRVQPADAIVLIDGERWQSSAQDRLIVEVPEGRHHIEITKEGFETYSTEITMAPGQTTPINVSLRSR
jgi:hypothetical protein